MKILNIKEKNCLTFNGGFEVEYEDKNGCKKTWELISRGNLDTVRRQIEGGERISASVSIVATDDKKERLCIIRQFRVAAGKYVYEFPAGLMDEGENVEEAAVREFKEETGMELKIDRISPPRYTSIGLSDERCSVVYGTVNICTTWTSPATKGIARKSKDNKQPYNHKRKQAAPRKRGLLFGIFPLSPAYTYGKSNKRGVKQWKSRTISRKLNLTT